MADTVSGSLSTHVSTAGEVKNRDVHYTAIEGPYSLHACMLRPHVLGPQNVIGSSLQEGSYAKMGG